jgi:hypothetical protein
LVPLAQKSIIGWRQTAGILRDLEAARRALFAEYLEMSGQDACGTRNPAIAAASLALLDCYWRACRRLPRIGSERPSSPSRCRVRRRIETELHPPRWENEVAWALWRTLDQRYLLWSDPITKPDQPRRKNSDRSSQQL